MGLAGSDLVHRESYVVNLVEVIRKPHFAGVFAVLRRVLCYWEDEDAGWLVA